MTEQTILDMCCGSRMFWFDKQDPRAVFADIRSEQHTCATGAVWLSVLTSLLTSVRCRSLMPHFRLLCLTRHILSASARPRGWAKSTGA